MKNHLRYPLSLQLGREDYPSRGNSVELEFSGASDATGRISISIEFANLETTEARRLYEAWKAGRLFVSIEAGDAENEALEVEE